MAIAFKMLRTAFHGESSRPRRVEALATIVMWFAAGAFATSTLASTFSSHEGQLIGAAGGVVAAIAALAYKAC